MLLITGIHGNDPIKLYSELCEVVEEVISHFEQQGRELPEPCVLPMQKVAYRFSHKDFGKAPDQNYPQAYNSTLRTNFYLGT